MKKLFLMFAAIAALFATSCVTDTTSDVAVTGGECDVTLSVVAPGADSRTIADGLKAVELVCGVYDAAWNYLTSVDGNFDGASTTTTISMRLVKGKTYNFVFWAQNPNAPYSLDLGTVGVASEPIITVDYTNVTTNESNVTANDDTLDAFFGKLPDYTVNGTVNETVYLKRPFAQINFGTSDEEAAKEFGFNVVDASAAATVTVNTMAYTTLSLKDGGVGGEQPVTFKAAAPATQTTSERLSVNNNSANYYWLAMNYILVPEAESSLANCDLTVKIPGQVDVKVSVPMAPARRNWRTNLVGQLLTEQGNFTIEILPIPEGELPNPDDNNLVHELILTAAVGGEITLTEDVVLTQPLTIAGDVVLNLNGKTLSGNFTKGGDAANAMIKNNATLTIVGGTIKNSTENGDAAIFNTGKLVLDGVKIEGAPIGTSGYPEYAVYSVGGTVVVEEGTEIVADRGAIRLEDGADVTINGGEFTVTDAIGSRVITAHLIYAKGSASKLTINDGDFAMHIANGGGTSVICPAGATIKIYGGNFYHAPVSDVQSGCFQNYMGSGSQVDVYGGTYNDDSVTKSGNLAAGYVAIEKNGVFVVAAAANNAETLATAIANGGLVALSEDIATTEAIEIPAGATATIDLNGKTITATTTDGIVAKAGATLTISGNGKVVSHAAPIRAIGGKVVVEGGEFTQTGDYYSTPSTLRYSVDSREGGEIIVKGGTFNTINGMINVSANSSVVIEGGIFDNTIQGAATRHFAYVAGTLTIKDGEFKSVANAGAGGTFFCGAGANGKVIVEGGKFTSLWNNGSKNNIWESYFGGSIEIKGGLFNHNGGISAQVTENTDAATKDAYPYMAK